MSEMSEIDQVHLRAVMLFMSETSEIVIIFNFSNVKFTSAVMGILHFKPYFGKGGKIF